MAGVRGIEDVYYVEWIYGAYFKGFIRDYEVLRFEGALEVADRTKFSIADGVANPCKEGWRLKATSARNQNFSLGLHCPDAQLGTEF